MTTTTPTKKSTRGSFHALASCYTRKHKPEVDAADIAPYDIICGRTRDAFNNCGNKRFHITIALNSHKYTAATNRANKSKIIMEVTALIHSNGGRFLKKSGKKYKELAMKHAREKVGHALRDHRAISKKAAITTAVIDKQVNKYDLLPAPSSKKAIDQQHEETNVDNSDSSTAASSSATTAAAAAAALERIKDPQGGRAQLPQYHTHENTNDDESTSNESPLPHHDHPSSPTPIAPTSCHSMMQPDDATSMSNFEAIKPESVRSTMHHDSFVSPAVKNFVRKLLQQSREELSTSMS